MVCQQNGGPYATDDLVEFRMTCHPGIPLPKGGLMELPKMALYARPWETMDNLWMLSCKVVEVPYVEPEIVVGIGELEGWSDYCPRDWPAVSIRKSCGRVAGAYYSSRRS
jgi:hypothetical protein